MNTPSLRLLGWEGFQTNKSQQCKSIGQQTKHEVKKCTYKKPTLTQNTTQNTRQ